MFSTYLLFMLTMSIIVIPSHTSTDPERYSSFPDRFEHKKDRARQLSDEELSIEATKNSDVYKRHQHDGSKQFWGTVIVVSLGYGLHKFYRWMWYGNGETKNTEASPEQGAGEKSEPGNNPSTEGASTGDSTAQ